MNIILNNKFKEDSFEDFQKEKEKLLYSKIYNKYFSHHVHYLKEICINKRLSYTIQDTITFHVEVDFNNDFNALEKISIYNSNLFSLYDLFCILCTGINDVDMQTYFSSPQGKKVLFDSFNMIVNNYVLEETRFKQSLEQKKVLLDKTLQDLSSYVD